MRGPGPNVKIPVGLRKREDGRKSMYITYWYVNGQEFSEGFQVKTQADGRRLQLRTAQKQGERFSPITGLPESWNETGKTNLAS